MKQFILALIVLTSFSLSSNAEQVLVGRAANDAVRGAEVVRFTESSSIPAYIQFRASEQIPFAEWQEWMEHRYFKESKHVGFELIRAEADRLGMVHYRFKQTANGHPITFGTWIVHTMNDMVVSMNGLAYDNVPAVGPALQESQALANALAHVGAETYKWEIPAEELDIKAISNDPNATYFPKGLLEVVNPDVSNRTVDLKLAWKFNIYADQPMSRQDVYVDAVSGAIVFENDLIHHADSNIIAVTGYLDTQNIIADFNGSLFRLRESGRGNGIFTTDLNNGTNGAGVDFTHGDNVWDDNSVDRYATDAHFGAEMTFDFFLSHFNRNSIDNNGFALRSRVHYGTNFANAFWDGQYMTYGDGSSGNLPFTALDIAGHEITHGLTEYSAGLIYQAESGALNESFSDVFAAAIERDALGPNSGEWLLGEDLNFLIRNMSNPNALGDPDTYFGNYWASLTGGDNGGVHTNSGVQNYWFYLLSEGGTGTNDNNDSYSVTAIGIEDAAAVAYRNLTVYLTESSGYADARFYGIQSAVDLFGGCSQEVESTWDAWYAVGVGGPYSQNVVADFEASGTENCDAPFSVSFKNLSYQGETFLWNFGDGNTSTAYEPEHTYQTTGDFTVSLTIASSCPGVSDSLVMVDLISIDPSLPCNFSLPASGGLATTQTSCEGVLYDDGGPAGTYAPNYNATVTIAPTNAVAVSLEFIEFNVEFDGSCQYDYLTIYDGPSTASTVIGKYCDGNPPPTFIHSTGSSITMQFSTDEALEEDGFKIGWECSIPSEAPDADFEADLIETCKGDIQFSDISALGANIPTQWFWDFGDGDTSNVKNPSHTYTSSGVYTVMMVASNAFGSDTVTKTNYINVDKPEAPEGEDVEVCPGDQANLIATSAGEHYWYTSLTGGSPVSVGDTFTTPIVQQSTPYYVEAKVAGPAQSTGAPDNNIGGGAYFNNYQSLYFNVYSDFRLKSVTVYTSLPGDREIIILDQTQTVVKDTLIYIATGEQTLELNWDLEVGTDFQMTVANGSMINLYRNNDGVNYPYEIPGVVSIHRSSAQGDPYSYYYFFYNWQVQDICISDRAMISASVGECTGIEEGETASAYAVFPNPTQGTVNISWNQNAHPGSISIFNAAGSLVDQVSVPAQSLYYNLDLGNLSSGIYLLKGSNGSTPMLERVIVE